MQKLFHGSLAMSMAQVVGNLAAFIIPWAVARVLGGEVFGVFAAAYALAVALGGLADMGLRVALIREVARTPRAWRRLSLYAVTFSLLLGLLLAAAFWLVSAWNGEQGEPQQLRSWLLAYALLWTLMRVSLAVAAGHQQLVSVAVWSAVERSGAAVVVLIALFGFGLGMIGLAKSMLVWELLVLAGVWLWQFSRPWASEPAPVLTLSGFAFQAAPFAVLAVVGSILGKLDMIVLGYQQAPKLVGLYAAAQTISWLPVFLGVAVAGTFFPALSAMAKERDAVQAKAILQPAIGVLSLLMVAISSVLAIGAGQWLSWIYGPAFRDGERWLVVFAFSAPILVVGSIVGASVTAWGWQKDAAKWATGIFALALPAFWLVGGWYGIWGVTALVVIVPLLRTVRGWLWMYRDGLLEGYEWTLFKLVLILVVSAAMVTILPRAYGWLALPSGIVMVFWLGVCRWSWFKKLPMLLERNHG